jgi:hypothetical protein
MPALFTDSEIRLDTGVKWIEELSKAYPDDFSMKSVLYYLKWKQSKTSLVKLKQIRNSALTQLQESKYWRMRNEQFRFSEFLDHKVPKVDSRLYDF